MSAHLKTLAKRFQECWNRLEGYWIIPNSKTERSPALTKMLPPELILYIAAFLPVSSAASFALCNIHISQLLGDHYWKALEGRKPAPSSNSPDFVRVMWTKPSPTARAEFLSFLEKDLPEHIFCERCDILHRPIFDDQSLRDRSRACWRADFCSTISRFALPPLVRFSLLQYVMKRHRMGLDCSKELRYFSH